MLKMKEGNGEAAERQGLGGGRTEEGGRKQLVLFCSSARDVVFSEQKSGWG